MSMGARLSLIGMYEWDDTLFDGMALPEDWGMMGKIFLLLICF